MMIDTARQKPRVNFAALLNKAPNGFLDIWQEHEGNSVTVAYNASPPRAWVADHWYMENGLGGTGTAAVITGSRATGVLPGSKYGLKVVVSTAPITAPASAMAVYFYLPNRDSLAFYGGIASAMAQIIAFGNVTQVGMQFFYATSDGKLTTAVGPEKLIPTNTSLMNLGQLIGVPLGTAMTTSGVIGVRIRVTAVSTGHVYDLANGFQVEQFCLTPGIVSFRESSLREAGGGYQPPPRAGKTLAEELAMCQYSLFKTFAQGEAPAQSTDVHNAFNVISQVVSLIFGGSLVLPVSMRVAPTVTTYNPSASNANWRDVTNSGDKTVTVVDAGANIITLSGASGAAGAVNAIHLMADARPALT